MNIIGQIRNRKIAIAVLVILTISIPVTVFIARKQQDVRTRAGGGSVQLQMIPQSLSKNPGDIFSVDVSIDAGTFSLSGIDTNISIDKNIVDFVSFNPASTFDQIIINNYSASTGILRITAVDVDNPASTGIVKIGALTLKAKSVGTAQVNFLNSQAVGLGQDTSLPIRDAVNGTYTFALPTLSPSPTPSPTPSPSPTPTKSPTPTPTKIPSPTPSPTPIIHKIILNPVADTFVRSTSPNQNFGTYPNLRNDTSPNEISYLKFNLAPLFGKTIMSAKLRIKVSDPTASTLTLKRSGNTSWNETNITYNTKPGFEANIRTFSANVLNSRIDLPVKNAVDLKKGGAITFGITSGADDSGAFYSKEAAFSNRPQLVIEYQ